MIKNLRRPTRYVCDFYRRTIINFADGQENSYTKGVPEIRGKALLHVAKRNFTGRTVGFCLPYTIFCSTELENQ